MRARAFSGAAVLTQLFALSVLLLPAAVPPVVAAKGQIENIESPTVGDENIDGKNFTVSRVLVHAKPEQIWHVLTDYHNAPRVFPQLKKCELVQDKGATKILKHQVNPSGLPACSTYTYTVEVKESYAKSLEWHRVSGDFKAVDGFWKLEPLNNGHDTLVTYSNYVSGGFFIPQMLIKRQCRVDMPNVLSNLKSESEGIKIAKRSDTSSTQ
ncbi:MAG TPA: SRPBCC family protein [Oculatellaceae cyanobacterium]